MKYMNEIHPKCINTQPQGSRNRNGCLVLKIPTHKNVFCCVWSHLSPYGGLFSTESVQRQRKSIFLQVCLTSFLYYCYVCLQGSLDGTLPYPFAGEISGFANDSGINLGLYMMNNSKDTRFLTSTVLLFLLFLIFSSVLFCHSSIGRMCGVLRTLLPHTRWPSTYSICFSLDIVSKIRHLLSCYQNETCCLLGSVC